jgi:hypothetical protein
VSVLLGNGNGTFQTTQNFPAGSRPYAVAVGDFNRDGWPDLAVTDSFANNVSVLLNAGDWSATPAQASSFVVSGFPLSTTAGTASSFTITAKNANGTTATNYTGTVHFSSSDGQASLPANYTFTAADAGVHTFSATLKTAGTQALTATDSTTASLTGSETGITVNPAAASTMTVAGFPSPTTTGVAGSFTVTLKDPYGNIATGYTGTVHFTSSAAKAALPANYTFTNANAGVHTFAATFRSAGSQSITATDTVTASITGSQTGITVNPGAVNHLVLSRFPSKTTAGVAQSFRITAQDLYGNTVTGFTDIVAFSSSDGQAILPSNYTFQNADAGIHNFSATLKTAGTQSLTVKDTTNPGVTSSTRSGITVVPAAASQFLIRAPSSVSAGVPFSLTIMIQDAYGNVVTGYTGTIHLTSTDGTATLPANYTFTATDNGVHTFTGLVLRKKGTQKITITDTLNSSLTGSVIENVL